MKMIYSLRLLVAIAFVAYPSLFTDGAYDDVEVENCEELGVLNKASCDEYCADQNNGPGYWLGSIVDDILIGAACSCGGNENTNPENVTKRCQSEVTLVVEDCYNLDPANNAGGLDAVRNKPECDMFCEGGVGRYVSSTASGEFLGLQCSCPATDEGPITKQCKSEYEMVTCESAGQTDCDGGSDVNCVDFCGDVAGDNGTPVCSSSDDGPVTCQCNDPADAYCTSNAVSFRTTFMLIGGIVAATMLSSL